MITFKQYAFLNEMDHSEKEDAAREIAETIKKNCQPFLKESGFNAKDPLRTGLFRGINFHGNTKFKMMTVGERQPLNTQPVVSDMLDDYFKENFGFRYRTKGTFAAGSHHTASHYGVSYLIFPIGNFSYCWSPKISDAYLFFDGYEDGHHPDGYNAIISYMSSADEAKIQDESGQIDTADEAWVNACAKYLKDKGHTLYQADDLQRAIRSYPSNEVMIGCSHYYVLYASGSAKADNRLDDADFTDLVLEYF